MPLIADFSQQLAPLIPAVGTEEFPGRLIDLFKVLLPVSDATIIRYPDTALPIIEYFEPGEDGSSHLDLFERGAFLLDPYYQAATRHRTFGFFQLRDLVPEGFLDSEYYKTFYHHTDYEDECGYLVAMGGDGFVNISLARARDRSPFGKRHLQLLEDITPVVSQLCRQHWDHPGNTGLATQNLRGQLSAALESFGSSQLTERETQVINRVLHGYSTKTVADKLSISMETVKLHRKHAYAKLGIGSQAELFYLFLDSLRSAKDYVGGDTLEAYLQPR
ncbi:MAG: LuxR C-terminal-related transcriptional regulator, partial [Gammaproteobacteria bacterium]|nr:LuxR C-terminal-related transcriptional regulator [Gammaproteobacteria bacterium]